MASTSRLSAWRANRDHGRTWTPPPHGCSRGRRAAKQPIARQLWPFNLRGVCAAYLAKPMPLRVGRCRYRIHAMRDRMNAIAHGLNPIRDGMNLAWGTVNPMRHGVNLAWRTVNPMGPWGESRLEDSESHAPSDESRLEKSESHGPWGESRLEDSSSHRSWAHLPLRRLKRRHIGEVSPASPFSRIESQREASAFAFELSSAEHPPSRSAGGR